MALHIRTALRPLCIATFLLAGALLSGCSTLGPDGLVASTAPAELSAPAASAVAGDLVPLLAEQMGQGKVTIALKPDNSPFGSALEASLRGWGYAVTTDEDTSDPKAIRLAYVLVPSDSQILARLSTGSIEIGRVYTLTQAGASPASPVSVMSRNRG